MKLRDSSCYARNVLVRPLDPYGLRFGPADGQSVDLLCLVF